MVSGLEAARMAVLYGLCLYVGRAGVPMEVMGLMLGEFVDDYTVRVIDVFAMPQSGTVSYNSNVTSSSSSTPLAHNTRTLPLSLGCECRGS